MTLKNISSTVRRYPVAVVLNFWGLVFSYLAFTVIFMQVGYELSFDECHPTSSRVFRVDKSQDNSLFRNILPRGFADDIISSSSHIEAGCVYNPFFPETYITIKEEGRQPQGYRKDIKFVTDGFLEVFGVKMVEGNAGALGNLSTAVIPESLAETMFPGESALGKILYTDTPYMFSETDGAVTVVGVYEDFPDNTQLDNAIYASLGHFQEGTYGGANYICYLLLDDVSNMDAVTDGFNSNYDFSPYEGWLSPIELTPFEDIYFLNEGNVYKSGSKGQLLLMVAIAFLILAIGLINFTNFYLALTPVRIKNVNLQKILGSSVGRLRLSVVAESVIWCLSACGIALLLTLPVSEIMHLQGLLPVEFAAGQHWVIVVFSLAAALLTGVAAGIWPGIYSTSGQPAVVLKGRFGLTHSGKTLRTVLVSMQFVISIALLIFVFFLQRQSRFMQEYPCGFEKEGLAVVDIGGKNSVSKSEWLREKLRTFPEIADVAYCMDLVGANDVYMTQECLFAGNAVSANILFCTSNFPEVLGVELSSGRGFSENGIGEVLLTENAVSSGAALEQYPDLGNVVGFVNNVNITSLRKSEGVVGFSVQDNRDYMMNFAYIRLAEGADVSAASAIIRKVLKEMDSVFQHDVLFYDIIGKGLYSGEERLRKLVSLFSLLAIVLSLVGIWGQVLMDVQYRRKEIAVKRVLGAEIKDIAGEGLRHYLKTVAVCFLIAAPAGWAVTDYYLKQFSHRTGFSVTVFLVTLAIVMSLCAAVVLYHYLKTAGSNLEDSLKND